MKITVEIDGEKRSGLPISFFREIIEKTLHCVDVSFLRSKDITVTISIVGDDEMRVLNKQHRNKEGTTDILSFGVYENRAMIQQENQKKVYLGEMIVNDQFVRRSAREDSVSLRREYIFLVSHGCLHLLGFEHSEKMFSLQDTVCDKIES